MTKGADYLSPLLFPLLPTRNGSLRLDVDCQRIVRKRFFTEVTEAKIDISFSVYHEGNLVEEKVRSFSVHNGVADPEFISMEYAPDELSYVEMSVRADRPAFRNIILIHGYVSLLRPGFGVINFGPDIKYAIDLVIKLIEATKTFCVYHGSCFVNEAQGIGNSFMLMNPYDQVLVAKIVSSEGNKITQKIPPKSMRVVDLAPILRDGHPSTVMMTGNNRIPAAVLRHPSGKPYELYSLDHVEPFSGFQAIERVPLKAYLRNRVTDFIKRSEWFDF